MFTRQLESDLRYVFSHFPTASLVHFRNNMHRLIRNAYQASGGGCIMFLLTESLPASQRIDSKEALRRFFLPQGGSDEHADYQAPRWIVRLWDRQICARVRARYGQEPELTVEFLRNVLDEVLAERREIEREAAAVEASASASLPVACLPVA